MGELVVLLHRYGARMDREEILEIFQAGLRIRVRMTRIRPLRKEPDPTVKKPSSRSNSMKILGSGGG